MNININKRTTEYVWDGIKQYIKIYGGRDIPAHFGITHKEFLQLQQQMDVGGPYTDFEEMYKAYSTEPGCSKSVKISKKKYSNCVLRLLAFRKKIISFI